MDGQEIAQKVREVVTDQLGLKLEDVKPEARLVEELGADSLDTVELVMALEEAFSLEIPDEVAQKVTTVREVMQYIEQKLHQLQIGQVVK